VVDENATHRKRVATMKEKLAGHKAAQAWAQERAADHLTSLRALYEAAKAPPAAPEPPPPSDGS